MGMRKAIVAALLLAVAGCSPSPPARSAEAVVAAGEPAIGLVWLAG